MLPNPRSVLTYLLFALLTSVAFMPMAMCAQNTTPRLEALEKEVMTVRYRFDDIQRSVLILSENNGATKADLFRLQESISHIDKQLKDLLAGSDQRDFAAIKEEITQVQRALTELKAHAPSVPSVQSTEVALATALNLNILWTLVTGFLVMFMQAGFAMRGAGFTRGKNVAHTMCMNLMAYALAILGFWISGFAIQFGGVGATISVASVPMLGPSIPANLNSELGIDLGGKFFGLLGARGFFLAPDMLEGGIASLFFYQVALMVNAATIPTGAMAERWRFFPFCCYAVIVGALIYPVFGNWVWGGGWLAALGKNVGLGHGCVDFAGSSVVHLCGGTIALVGARILGPRHGKFNADGSSNPIPGHNIPLGVIGTFILAFGWFGFTAGATLSGTDAQIGVIAINTMLASAAGAAASMITTWRNFGRPDPSFMCNGMLAGLVAISAACAFVDSWAAVIVGFVAGVLVVASAGFVERLRVDDPVGAISVHGACGIWGVLSLGLFANGRYGDGWNGVAGNVKGLFYGDANQFVAEVVGATVCILVVSTVAGVVFLAIGRLTPHRSPIVDEIIGLDQPELGVLGYQPDTDKSPT